MVVDRLLPPRGAGVQVPTVRFPVSFAVAAGLFARPAAAEELEASLSSREVLEVAFFKQFLEDCVKALRGLSRPGVNGRSLHPPKIRFGFRFNEFAYLVPLDKSSQGLGKQSVE